MAKGSRRTQPSRKPRLISVAMIARNEAGNLHRAVDSASRFADEIILVDTGSTDNTVKVAKALGCKVHSFPWVHDFAAARNFSFSKCRCDYIWWQDPDEEVPAEDATKIREYARQSMLLKEPADEFVFATYINGTYRPPERDLPGYGPGFVVMKPRMVRRGQLVWRHRIHEDLYRAGDLVRHTDEDVRVFNHGDANATDKEYYHCLMYLSHKDNPTEPHYLLYLAEHAQVSMMNPHKAMQYLDQIDPERLASSDQVEKFWLFKGRCYKMIAVYSTEAGDADQAKDAADQAVLAYNHCKTMRGPLEAATMFLFLGARAPFDDITQQVRKQEPEDLMAQQFEKLSNGFPDDVECNEAVGRFLMNLREGAVDMDVAFEAAIQGKHFQELEAEPWDEAKEHRQIVVAIVYRLADDAPERRRNFYACLDALSRQDVDPEKWKLVLVEQDSEKRTDGSVPHDGNLGPYTSWMFDRSYEPFNRGSAFNFAFDHSDLINDDLICLMDADMLVDPGWLRRCLTLMTDRAMLPYDKAVYMDERTTLEAIEKGGAEHVDTVTGDTWHAQGGCIWVRADFYQAIDGHHDEYVGWGSADRDFYQRIIKGLGKAPQRIAQPLYHMWHPKPDESAKQKNADQFAEDWPDIDEAEAARQ